MTSLGEFINKELDNALKRYEAIKNKSDTYSTGYVRGVIYTYEDLLKNENFKHILNLPVDNTSHLKYELNGFGSVVIVIEDSKVSKVGFVPKNDNPIRKDKLIKELLNLSNRMGYEKWNVYDTAVARIMVRDQLEKWIVEIASIDDPDKRSIKVNLI